MVLGDSCNNQFFRLPVEAGLIAVPEVELGVVDETAQVCSAPVRVA